MGFFTQAEIWEIASIHNIQAALLKISVTPERHALLITQYSCFSDMLQATDRFLSLGILQVIMLRSLFTYTRVLPAFKIFKAMEVDSSALD